MEQHTKDESDFLQFLQSEGYLMPVKIPGRGWCGIKRMLYTFGLFYNITPDCSGDGRYCFRSVLDAALSLGRWNGLGDPPGAWIKHKGKTGEYMNPNSL